MSLKHIVHFVDIYPLIQYKYIYDQIADKEDKKNIVIAERFLGNPLHKDFHYFRKVKNKEWFMRADSLFTDRIPVGNYLYLKAIDKFYRKKLKIINTPVMHAHSGMVGYKLSNLRKELGIPLVVTFYGNDVSYCLENDRWSRRYSDMFKAGDMFIVLCNEVKKRLIRRGCPEEKIRLWNIGLDLENYPYKERSDKGPIKFLTVARFVEAKGYPVLLKAFSNLLIDHKDIALTLVGYGPLKKQITNLIQNFGIEKKVSVIDTAGRPDFYSFFKNILYTHDIYVLPSTTSKYGEDEGGPALTMIYAQSSGLAVISTPFPGSEISVIDGETGLLCKQDSPESLRERMEYLIGNNSLRNKLGLNASILVQREFSLIPQLNKLHNIYDDLSF